MDTLRKDLRYALRTLLNAPAFTVVAVLTLALGIGVNTAMFSVVNAVLLRPLPFPQPDRLMSLTTMNWRHGAPGPNAISYPDFLDYRSGNRSFQNIASYYDSDLALTGHGEAVMLRGQIVASGLLKVLGVQPALGRDFLPEDDEAGHHVAILSHTAWQARFQGDLSVVGKSVTLGGKPYTVIGIMPEGFQFPVRSQATDVWVTMARDFDIDKPGDKPVGAQRGAHFMSAIGRLKPGVTREQAESDMTAIARALAVQYPNSNTYNKSVRVEGYLTHLVGDTRTPLTILLAAVGFVLLIACANVANLVMTRSSGRSREMAVRAALGATRGRIVRQLITESMVLATSGAFLGALLAEWGVSAMVKLYPQNLPRAEQVGMDGRVLLFTVALAIFTAILFGLMPALQASRTDVNEAMREGGRGSIGDAKHTRVRSVLVIAETALGVMLLIGAGLLIRSLNRLSRVDLGFNPSHLLTANFDLSQTRYNGDKMDLFVTELLGKLRAIPGVMAVGGTQQLPLSNDDWGISFDIVERRLPPSQQPSAGFYTVTTDFFQALQIPLLQGRLFDERDNREGNPVMIVNREFASKFFPNENPIGKLIEIGAGEGKARERWKTREVVGVVGDIRSSDLDQAPRAAYFVPQSQLMWGPPTLILRTAGDPNSVAPQVRKIIAAMDPDAPVYDIKTMEDYLALDLGRARFQTVLLGLFAGIALLLTAIGLYGVIAYGVAQRTHEIGVRMALGASRSDVLRMVVNRGLLLTLAGVGAGVLGAVALARFIQSLLYQTPPRDPLTYTVVCVSLSIVALLASYIPAMRATRIDPMVALRYE
ncbi:MAG TPA: ABC transporter permease [Terriglobales bacterium]|nr:ABC transporter permease [Terriglobales bacterium]